MENDKYYVFKAEFLHEHGMDLSTSDIFDHALDDAVVIRPQDIFAGPGLHAYAAAISTGIELIKMTALLPPELRATLHELEVLRDFFHEQAVRADDWPNKKLPD